MTKWGRVLITIPKIVIKEVIHNEVTDASKTFNVFSSGIEIEQNFHKVLASQSNLIRSHRKKNKISLLI